MPNTYTLSYYNKYIPKISFPLGFGDIISNGWRIFLMNYHKLGSFLLGPVVIFTIGFKLFQYAFPQIFIETEIPEWLFNFLFYLPLSMLLIFLPLTWAGYGTVNAVYKILNNESIEPKAIYHLCLRNSWVIIKLALVLLFSCIKAIGGVVFIFFFVSFLSLSLSLADSSLLFLIIGLLLISTLYIGVILFFLHSLALLLHQIVLVAVNRSLTFDSDIEIQKYKFRSGDKMYVFNVLLMLTAVALLIAFGYWVNIAFGVIEFVTEMPINVYLSTGITLIINSFANFIVLALLFSAMTLYFFNYQANREGQDILNFLTSRDQC
jgi:hypothetical protein